MMFLTTRTETEALLLEQNLIKQLKPRYNVLLRDDKSFPNILVTARPPVPADQEAPRARKEQGRYFGPFASAGSVNRTLNQLQKAFLLRSCSDAMFESRTRPCLLLPDQALQRALRRADRRGGLRGAGRGRGAVPARQVDPGAGAARRGDGRRRARRWSSSAPRRMRDRIRALTNVQATQGINPEGVEEADVVALHQEGGQACVQVFFIRAHQNWGNRAYFPRTGAGAEPGGDPRGLPRPVLRQQDAAAADPASATPPDNADLLAEALRAAARAQGGDRACRSAARRRGWSSRRRATPARRWRGGWPRAPARRRCSTGSPRPSGSTARRSGSRSTTTATSWAPTRSAAMIVAGPEGFLKSQYRKFNIKRDRARPRATTSA